MKKFVCDAMLHKLCIWLRIAGQKCTYIDSESHGDEAIKTATREGAVLLTRDKALAQKAVDYCEVQLLRSHGYVGQLSEVVQRNKIKLKLRERFCTVCGGELNKVPKKTVKNKVWPFTFKTHKNFLQCAQCKKVFWRGSHWKKIKTVLTSLSTW